MTKQLFGNAAIYLGANILSLSVPFLLLPILTRVLTPADYGVVAMFGVLLSVLSAFTGLSVHGAIGVRYFQLDSVRLAEYVGTCLAVLFISTLFVLGVVVLAREWLSEITQVPVAWLFVGVAISGAQFVTNIRLSIWRVRHQAVRFGAMEVFGGLVNAGLSLYLVLGLSMAWQGRLLGQLITALTLMMLSLVWLIRSSEVAVPQQPIADASDALRFGVPLIPHILGGVFIGIFDRLMITNLLDLSQAGVYAVGAQIGMVFGLVAGAFNNSYAPWLMKQLTTPNCGRDLTIVRGTYLYFLIAAVSAIVIGLSAPWLLLLVGKDFREAAPLIIYIALGSAFSGMYLMVTNYIFFAGKTAYLAWVTLSTGVFDVLAVYLMIKFNGLVGVAQAFMVAMAIKFFATWMLAQKCHPMPWKDALFPAPA